jgi:FtsZ-interacting cell division protein ZipA
METLTKISFIIYLLAIAGLLAVIIWASIKTQKAKYEKRQKEFLDMSTKLDHTALEEHLKGGNEAFIKRLNP